MYKLVKAIHKISPLEELKVVGERVQITLAKDGVTGKQVLAQLETRLGNAARVVAPYATTNIREGYKGRKTTPSFRVTLLLNGKLKIENGQPNKPIGRIALLRVLWLAQKLQNNKNRVDPLLFSD